MTDTSKDDGIEWSNQPLDFHALTRAIAIGSIRIMISRLKGVGSFDLPDDVQLERLELRALHFLENKLRDILRTLGGAR